MTSSSDEASPTDEAQPAPAPDGTGRRRLDGQSWNDLFDYLDPDRPTRTGAGRDGPAEARYREVSHRLAAFFAGRGCGDADDLAVETMLRVAARCREHLGVPAGDRLAYFYGVARNVHHEWIRRAARDTSRRDAFRRESLRVPPLGQATRRGQEAAHDCLDRCLAKLTPRARTLAIRYYGEERAAKIHEHRQLAEEFGKSINALRIEMHRVRATLRQCVLECVRPGSTT